MGVHGGIDHATGALGDLVRLGETGGIINKHQSKLLAEIRGAYNSIKHDTRFTMERCDLEGMLAKFETLINRDEDA